MAVIQLLLVHFTLICNGVRPTEEATRGASVTASGQFQRAHDSLVSGTPVDMPMFHDSGLQDTTQPTTLGLNPQATRQPTHRGLEHNMPMFHDSGLQDTTQPTTLGLNPQATRQPTPRGLEHDMPMFHDSGLQDTMQPTTFGLSPQATRQPTPRGVSRDPQRTPSFGHGIVFSSPTTERTPDPRSSRDQHEPPPNFQDHDVPDFSQPRNHAVPNFSQPQPLPEFEDRGPPTLPQRKSEERQLPAFPDVSGKKFGHVPQMPVLPRNGGNPTSVTLDDGIDLPPRNQIIGLPETGEKWYDLVNTADFDKDGVRFRMHPTMRDEDIDPNEDHIQLYGEKFKGEDIGDFIKVMIPASEEGENPEERFMPKIIPGDKDASPPELDHQIVFESPQDRAQSVGLPSVAVREAMAKKREASFRPPQAVQEPHLDAFIGPDRAEETNQPHPGEPTHFTGFDDYYHEKFKDAATPFLEDAKDISEQATDSWKKMHNYVDDMWEASAALRELQKKVNTTKMQVAKESNIVQGKSLSAFDHANEFIEARKKLGPVFKAGPLSEKDLIQEGMRHAKGQKYDLWASDAFPASSPRITLANLDAPEDHHLFNPNVAEPVEFQAPNQTPVDALPSSHLVQEPNWGALSDSMHESEAQLSPKVEDSNEDVPVNIEHASSQDGLDEVRREAVESGRPLSPLVDEVRSSPDGSKTDVQPELLPGERLAETPSVVDTDSNPTIKEEVISHELEPTQSEQLISESMPLAPAPALMSSQVDGDVPRDTAPVLMSSTSEGDVGHGHVGSSRPGNRRDTVSGQPLLATSSSEDMPRRPRDTAPVLMSSTSAGDVGHSHVGSSRPGNRRDTVSGQPLLATSSSEDMPNFGDGDTLEGEHSLPAFQRTDPEMHPNQLSTMPERQNGDVRHPRFSRGPPISST